MTELAKPPSMVLLVAAVTALLALNTPHSQAQTPAVEKSTKHIEIKTGIIPRISFERTTVEMKLGESEVQRREREAREAEERRKPKLKPSPSKKYDSEVTIIGQSSEQCVLFVRRMTGNEKVHGYAGNLVPEGTTPQVGAVALERNYGHVSLVVAITGNSLVLQDANWVRGAITQRVVPIDSQRGYIY